jgi:hypothetical protein
MAEQVLIDSRFRGPADSGNGGYSCGALASFVAPRSAEVTLRLPPPLDRPLEVERDGTAAVMRDGNALVAEARAIDDLEIELPRPVDVEEAATACGASAMQHDHPYPGCFVCGSARQPGDGLRVTCGPTDDGTVAAPWKVDDTVADEDGEVPPEIVWAVLDCPGGIAGMLMPDLGVSMLGRLAARVYGTVEPGMTCVAVGWPIDRDGRKFYAGSAIFSSAGDPLAHARATWIELKR